MAQGTEEQDLGQLLSRLSALVSPSPFYSSYSFTWMSQCLFPSFPFCAFTIDNFMQIEDISVVESGPRVEKKQAYIIVRHVKFGPSKKGSGKKASKVSGTTTSPEVQNIATSTPSIKHSPIHREEILDPAESGLETEDEILSEEEDTRIAPSLEMPDKDVDNKNPSWSVFGANDEFDSVFDFGDDTKIASSSEVGTENRYRREPNKGTGARDATRTMPPFPNQHRQPQFGLNPSPSGRGSNPGETNGSLVGNLKIPANDVPKQERQHARAPAPGSPVSGYGIFSASEGNDASEKNNVPAEFNRYKKGSSFDSTRQPWPRGVSARQNSPTSNLDGGGGRPGVDKRWGREMGNVR